MFLLIRERRTSRADYRKFSWYSPMVKERKWSMVNPLRFYRFLKLYRGCNISSEHFSEHFSDCKQSTNNCDNNTSSSSRCNNSKEAASSWFVCPLQCCYSLTPSTTNQTKRTCNLSLFGWDWTTIWKKTTSTKRRITILCKGKISFVHQSELGSGQKFNI